jgi:hypothetical protein
MAESRDRNAQGQGRGESPGATFPSTAVRARTAQALARGPSELKDRHRDRSADTACRARLTYCPLAGSP